MPSVSRSDASQPPSGCFLRGVRKHSDGWCKASEWGVDDVRTSRPRHSLSIGTSCGDFLPLLVPSDYPAAFAAGDGAAGDADDLTDIRDTHCFQRLALGIADVIEGMALRHEEVAAPALQFAHAAAREATDTLALLVIDVVPVLCLLDIRYLLCLGLNSQRYK